MISKNNILTTICGAILGSSITYFCMKKHFEDFANAEIQSVKETYKNKANNATNKSDDTTEETPANESVPFLKDEERKSVSFLKDEERKSVSFLKDEERKTVKNYTDCFAYKSKSNNSISIKVISPEEFGEDESYDTICYDYADGVLFDERNEVVDDYKDTIGADFYKHFGEYENDSVHIRNDNLKCYYEIVRVISSDYENIINKYSGEVDD